ncbi:MAG: amidinotransferase [Alphaproteobacteria bacterium]|nr:amidinotransferase [Alphaproteobacteria bacterium]
MTDTLKTAGRLGQAPSAVVMVLPHHFYPNDETAADNAFQHDAGSDRAKVAQQAYDEVVAAAEKLRAVGVTVHLFEDKGTATPDSVFPNNWFSTHRDGRIALYPMYAPSRRPERRADIVDALKAEYSVSGIVDYSGAEADDLFLEGTGAMVLDHLDRIAYISLSHRADETLARRFGQEFNYEPVMFETVGPDGNAIYHTNVMMNVGTKLALVGFETITDPNRRQTVRQRLEATGRTIVDLGPDQINQFAGNAFEVRGKDGLFLVMSETASRSLTTEQRGTIEAEMPILPFSVPTIELAGGSARCMLAGIHLPPR